MSGGLVHVVTARQRLVPDARTPAVEVLALTGFIERAIAAGADVVQVREPDLEPRLFVDLVRRAVAAVHGRATRVVVNDRVDVTLAAGAHGVHLRSAGLPADRVRPLVGQRLIGRSTHAGDCDALETAVDYVLFGTVFPTSSKTVETRWAGLEGLARAVTASPRPVLAIGGISPDRAEACATVGAAGVAGIGIFLPPGATPGALGVAGAVAALRAALARGRTHPALRDATLLRTPRDPKAP